MKNFIDLGISAQLVESLGRMKISVPTPIQAATIPIAIGGEDLLASAQTGSGKTVAYSIPLMMKLADCNRSCALILTPTRELAFQVQQTLKLILGGRDLFKTTLLIGGMSMSRQLSELSRRPRIIVGTPGRINDHLERRTLSLDEARFLVIDEADRMLDMGFGIQLDRIAEYLPKERQTLMFSATFPSNIEKLSRKYLSNPQRVSIDLTELTAPKINQEMIQLSTSEKLPQLVKQLETREGSIIVFVRTKRGADRLTRELQKWDHNAQAIHGDLPQSKRGKVIDAFRNSRTRILVATDVAARGLDIPHVMHVINYDLPQSPEDYIHRIGRTGRAGAEGSALCFVTREDIPMWRSIVKLIDPEAAKPEFKTAQPDGSSKKPGGNSFKPHRRRFGYGARSKSFSPRRSRTG